MGRLVLIAFGREYQVIFYIVMFYIVIFYIVMFYIPSALLDTVENRTVQGEIGIDTEITPSIFYSLFDYMNERELLSA